MTPLHKLYTLSGWLSGVFLVLICVLVVAQIVARQLGTMVPAADEFAAYAMAASGFLALPYALQRGAHIRVELLLRLLPAGGRLVVDVLATLVGLGIATYMAGTARCSFWSPTSSRKCRPACCRFPCGCHSCRCCWAR